jgi:putative alpha-1,2-mannosidase
MKPQRVLILSAVVLVPVAAQDPAKFVNPFIGTINGGHVFSGATLPWGSVKAGADSSSGDNQAGYVSDGSPIVGISSLSVVSIFICAIWPLNRIDTMMAPVAASPLEISHSFLSLALNVRVMT